MTSEHSSVARDCPPARRRGGHSAEPGDTGPRWAENPHGPQPWLEMGCTAGLGCKAAGICCSCILLREEDGGLGVRAWVAVWRCASATPGRGGVPERDQEAGWGQAHPTGAPHKPCATGAISSLCHLLRLHWGMQAVGICQEPWAPLA